MGGIAADDFRDTSGGLKSVDDDSFRFQQKADSASTPLCTIPHLTSLGGETWSSGTGVVDGDLDSLCDDIDIADLVSNDKGSVPNVFLQCPMCQGQAKILRGGPRATISLGVAVSHAYTYQCNDSACGYKWNAAPADWEKQTRAWLLKQPAEKQATVVSFAPWTRTTSKPFACGQCGAPDKMNHICPLAKGKDKKDKKKKTRRWCKLQILEGSMMVLSLIHI